MDAIDSAKDYAKAQSRYDYYISIAETWLKCGRELALNREWGGICDNDGITIGATLDHLLFGGISACKEFKSVDGQIGGRVFYNTPIEAAKLNLEIAKTRNALARHRLQNF